MGCNSTDDLYADLDDLIEQLKGVNLVEPSEKLHAILHQTAWTTSSELLGEVKLALIGTKDKYHDSLPTSLLDHIERSIKTITDLWNG